MARQWVTWDSAAIDEDGTEEYVTWGSSAFTEDQAAAAGFVPYPNPRYALSGGMQDMAGGT